MSPRFRARKTQRIWPFRVTVNQSGKVTWGIKVWRYSWSHSTGEHHLDTPGPGSLHWGGRKRGAKCTATSCSGQPTLPVLLREQAAAPASVRASANELIDEIDQLIRALHQCRSELCTAARLYDDETNRRVDELLRKRGRR